MLLGEEILLLLLNEKKKQLKKGTLDHSDLNFLLPATILEDLKTASDSDRKILIRKNQLFDLVWGYAQMWGQNY